MSGPTDPAEEHFDKGLWGWVTDTWKKLVADAAGHLQVDVVTSGLPTGGATGSNQTTMITALQLIDDMRNALDSVATDELDVVLDGQNLDVEVKQVAPADLAVGLHGYISGAWQKAPLPFGYSDIYYEGVRVDHAGAGSYWIYGSVVPAGEIWVVNTAVMWGNVNIAGQVTLTIQKGSEYHHLTTLPSLAANKTMNFSGQAIVAPTYRMAAYFGSIAANNQKFMEITGYKVDLDL